MSGLLGKAAAGLLAVAVTVAVAALGRLPVTLDGGDDALVRLSWRLRGSEVERACRRPTPEELEELPAHMRNPDACVGRLDPYRLRVLVDGDTVVDEIVRAAGARQDRPIYVFREVSVAPGRHELEVSFRQDELEDEDDHDEDDEPLALHLEAPVDLVPREVLLVTWDADRERLFLVGGTERR